jgi:hypothetical protein
MTTEEKEGITNMENKDLLDIGFKELNHFTIGNSVHYDLGRNRLLSGSCIGTPNEILAIMEVNEENNKKVDAIIILHNYDYDGYLTLEKITTLIKVLTNGK